jgi:signal transduction histidine kinase
MATNSKSNFLAANQTNMGALIRAHNWAATAVGSIEQWPQSLQSVVGLMLNSAFPMFVAWGPELRTIYNDGYAQILGEKHPQALGRPFLEIWREIEADLVPLIKKVLGGEAFYMENLLLRVHRRGYEEETWFTFSYSPVVDEEGMTAGLYCVCTETTRMVLAEKHIRGEHERLATLFQKAPGFMAVLRGPNHEFENVNDAYLAHVGNRDLLGKPVANALPEIAEQGFVALLDKVFASGETFSGQATPVILNKTPSGTPSLAYVDFVYQPLRDASGLVQGIFVQGHEVTERHEAQIALSNANRRKDEFLAMLGHELRNPLAPIGAAAELLQMAKLDEARVHQTSQIISRQVDHMTHLIDDLLDVSRVTQGMVKLDPVPLDVRFIVSEAVEQVTPLIQSRRHHFALHMQPATTIVKGDKKRLVQVLTNLLNNAAKYTNEGGSILLKTDVRESHVLIEIIDNGIGMPPDLVSHVFELFAQGERTSDRSAGGLGLGLALVKSLVELHHGTVHCESEGLGKGSKFTVCLPRVVEETCQDKQLSVDGLLGKSTRPLRILLVDDNQDAATMLAMLLEAAGHNVVVTHSSRHALKLAESALPEVCLLDIGLPEMDGNELATHLRAQPETAKSILIAVTGYGQESDREQAMAVGFDYHLVKPVDTKRLASILAKISQV